MKRTIGMAAAVAVALSAALAVGVWQAPAQAEPKLEKYYVVNNLNGDSIYDWFWIDELEGIIGCPKCGWLIDLAKSHELTADAEKQFQHNLMDGMAKMSQAKTAPDSRTADRLRGEAMDAFDGAARALGSASVRPGLVGYYDPDRRSQVPANREWLSAADQDLADGLALLQRSFSDPSPQPWISAALAEFTEAYDEIAAKRAIG